MSRPTPDRPRPRRRDRWLLALLVIVWGISWPAIKLGVASVPPLWYGCLRYLVAAGCLFAVVAARRELGVPSRSDWRLVGVSGGLQMGVYAALTGLALTKLPAGRASVLAYSTPVWVVPLAAWRLGERLSWAALAGVALGLAGAGVIAAPGLRAGRGEVVAYAMLLGAAASWATAIVYVRAHRFDATALALAPWQMLVAAVLLGPLALVVEGAPPGIGPVGAASLAYVGPVATAFAYWAVVETGRRFPASTLSMALLGTPALGLLLSAVVLGEPVTASLLVGAVLIGAGIRSAGVPDGARTSSY